MDNSVNPYASPVAQSSTSDDIAKHLSDVAYPLRLSFKILALSRQATVTDANGTVILYTKQKLLKFREHVEIFTDKSRAVKLADIKANKVIDWSARYNFTDRNEMQIGSVGRRGWRSIWRAHYEVFNPGDQSVDFSIREENAMVKVFDSLLGQIPIIGVLTSYLFNPKYLATRSSGDAGMRMTKRPAFWEGKFTIEKLGDVTPREELNLILSYLMMVMLERSRG